MEEGNVYKDKDDDIKLDAINYVNNLNFMAEYCQEEADIHHNGCCFIVQSLCPLH